MTYRPMTSLRHPATFPRSMPCSTSPSAIPIPSASPPSVTRGITWISVRSSNACSPGRAPRGLMGPTTRGIGIYYSDTHSVAPAEWRSDACISVAADVSPPDEASAPRLIDLAGGRHAVLRHKGPYAELHKAYDWLFGQWLPGSGEMPADRPVFEEYLNNPRELPPEEWLTEINLPLVAR